MEGVFLTFEGIEGCGKTTQVSLLGEHLARKGYPLRVSREPGGTPIGESLREILLHSRNRSMLGLTELLLIEAIRHQHVEEVIRPSLRSGGVVLCDRFSDATLAYQHFGRGIERGIVEQVDRWATGGLKPGFTVLLDCPVEEGIRRSLTRLRQEGKAEGESRFEEEDLEFHRRVREGYLQIAREEPQRVRVIEALGGPEEIHQRLVPMIEEWLSKVRRKKG